MRVERFSNKPESFPPAFEVPCEQVKPEKKNEHDLYSRPCVVLRIGLRDGWVGKLASRRAFCRQLLVFGLRRRWCRLPRRRRVSASTSGSIRTTNGPGEWCLRPLVGAWHRLKMPRPKPSRKLKRPVMSLWQRIGMIGSRRSRKSGLRLSKAVGGGPVQPTRIRNRTLRRSARPPTCGSHPGEPRAAKAFTAPNPFHRLPGKS
jgi:hypothetical protein